MTTLASMPAAGQAEPDGAPSAGSRLEPMARPWRIAMVSKALVVGAYQRKAELLASEPDLRLTVIVPTAWREAGTERRLERPERPDYRLIETQLRLNGHFHLHWYPRLPALFRSEQPHLVHLDEEPYNLATVLGVRAARACGARSLFFAWQNLARRYPPPFRWLERWVYRTVDAAIAGSQTAAQVLRAKGYRGRLAVIPQFGVDTRQFFPESAPRPADELVVGYVGRLVPAKGVDLLLRALADLTTPWQLVIAGEGPARRYLQHLAWDLGIADRILWTGWLASAALAERVRSLHILVLPSRSTRTWTEQFGRVLVEAMACRVACIGAASGEIPHVLGESGLTFPEGDWHALRHCLRLLADDPNRRERLAEAGYRRALAQFTMEGVAAATADLYRALLRGDRPGASGQLGPTVPRPAPAAWAADRGGGSGGSASHGSPRGLRAVADGPPARACYNAPGAAANEHSRPSLAPAWGQRSPAGCPGCVRWRSRPGLGGEKAARPVHGRRSRGVRWRAVRTRR